MSNRQRVNQDSFVIQIEDRHAAEFWLQEWEDRYTQTKDGAFREQAELMRGWITNRWPDDDKDW